MGDSSPDAAARKREYQRRYYQANRDKIREGQRERYLTNREQILAKARQRYADDPALREKVRKYQDANRDQIRDRLREWNRKRRAVNPERAKREQRRQHLRKRHGLDEITWAAMWEAQQGKCRYCRRDLDETAHVDHWHDCGTGHAPENSCAACRRGLSCQRCNHIIGFAEDDPSLLVQIAAELRVANAEVMERQATAPEQLLLELE